HWSTSKTPSYTKSVSWQHHPTRLTSFALVRIPSRLIAKKRAKERRSLSANGPITHAGSIDPLSGVSDI
ncbi:hypothetical protein, partial [Escherichia coli]|uniref:hypothetical protein n=1 Tax=Escherichia coli TaxID=562 RepID=UPI001A7E159A